VQGPDGGRAGAAWKRPGRKVWDTSEWGTYLRYGTGIEGKDSAMTATEEQESTPIFTELTEQLGFSQDTVAEVEREQTESPPPEARKSEAAS
jgi:hypothetical protein